ncbi:Vesicle-associated protein 2-1 [Hibiscus syriacus]|uniref:Vesicle-associated protein 2-1 n=1 Tax=Hibiscus syriacus TaxID=106335 RepID=A0A6A3CJJ7_HIBSY|nr:Vesicle-associated protein 2-1 [Hibiscus syriacus]
MGAMDQCYVEFQVMIDRVAMLWRFGYFLVLLFMFSVELEKPSFCDLKVVKTTSPNKYFVRPNTSVVQPLDSSVIRVTLQAQLEYPPDMQCKDKFLLHSTVVPPNTDVDNLPADTARIPTFSREIQKCKLKVFYVNPSEDEGFKSYPEQGADSNSTVQHLKDERDTAVRQTLQLQQELRRRQRRNDSGFSLMFAFVVGLIGILVGFLLSLSLSSSLPPPSSPFVDSSTPLAPPSVD